MCVCVCVCVHKTVGIEVLEGCVLVVFNCGLCVLWVCSWRGACGAVGDTFVLLLVNRWCQCR